MDHTSEMQLQGWLDLVTRLYETYNASPLGQQKLLDQCEFYRFTAGMYTDHAKDQKKLAHLFKTYKEFIERECCGKEKILSMSMNDVIPMLWDECQHNIDAVGGQMAYNALSPDRRDELLKESWSWICQHLGEEAINAMSPEEQHFMALFIWGQCCMHKEMNSVKGSNVTLMAFWEVHGLTPPMKLYNKDNALASRSSDTNTVQQAADNSTRGAIKLTSFAGTLFVNKDKKKGQQDSLQVLLELEMGYMIQFPDTSNTQYQSHCLAAAELLIQ